MPSNILAADVLFPHLTPEQSTDEKFTVVTDYLYMLLEQLRYTLANLGTENFNETELSRFSEIIAEPVYMQLQDVNGKVTDLSVTAEGLVSRVSGAEGNISILAQTADKINWLVASGTSASNFTMTSRAISLVSESINLTGYVTFASLLDPNATTTIAGGAISTSTITSSTFEAETDIYGNVYGGMDLYCRTYNGRYQVGALNTDVLGNQCRVYLRSRTATPRTVLRQP